MKGRIIYLVFLLILISTCSGKREIHIYCSAAIEKPMLEISRVYEQMTGNSVDISFYGVGTLVNKAKYEKKADLLITSSPKYMDRLERENVIEPRTRQFVCFLTPAIIVQKGNPRNITGLTDLLNSDLRVGVGIPGIAALGDVAENIFAQIGESDAFKQNIRMYLGSGYELFLMIYEGKVDAIIGWRAFAQWAPDKLQAVDLPKKISRKNRIEAEAAATLYSDRSAAKDFIKFLKTRKSRKIFKKYGYEI